MLDSLARRRAERTLEREEKSVSKRPSALLDGPANPKQPRVSA